MSRFLPFLFCALFFLTNAKGFCLNDEVLDFEKCSLQKRQGYVNEGKFYIFPGTVYVAPGGIFLNIENELVKISSVFSDIHGVYVTIEELRSVGKTWICDICYFENPIYLKYCQTCSYEGPKSK